MSDALPMMMSGTEAGSMTMRIGAATDPILPAMEAEPTAVVLTAVGYSSAVYW